MIEETKKPVVLRSVENESRPSPKKTMLKTEAEKVLTEQLLLGKVPPKAKFRADDEISIGDPADSNNEPFEPPSTAKTSPEKENPSRTEKIDMSQGSQEAKHRLSDIPAASRLIEEARRTNSLPLNTAPLPAPKNQGDKFFQRLSNLRRSFNTTDYRRSGGKIRPHINRRDSPFFEGIPPEVRKPGRARGSPVHGTHLVLHPLLPLYRPPARKYPGCAPTPASEGTRLKRSLSFSDARVIAQSVVDGDPKVIHELFPGFPFSDPIYTVIDRAKNVQQGNDTKTVGQDKQQPSQGTADGSITATSQDDLNSSNSSTVVNINKEDVVAGEDHTPRLKTTSRPSITSIVVNPSDPQVQELISPWGGSCQTTPIKKSPDNVVSVECKSPSIDPTLPSQPHPFIYRVQNQVEFSPRPSSSPLSPPVFQLQRQTTLPTRPLQNSLQDPFKKILEAADSNIHQAESILSSLGYDGFGMSTKAEEEEPMGLGSDIETNIRRLEKTQAKINAALKTFRNVRNLQSPHAGGDTTFCSLPAWEQAVEEEQAAVYPAIVPEEAEPKKKNGIVRRHSFNNLAAKEKSPEPNSSYGRESFYDGDVDSSDPSTRNSAVYDDGSDTEGNLSPFRSRIRGLFGSFGKGKKAVSRMHSEERTGTIDKRMITIEYPDHTTSMDQGAFSIGQFTELVKSLPANNFSSESVQDVSRSSTVQTEGQKTAKKPTFLRPKDPPPSKSYLCQNNSTDTFSSVSTSQSFNLSSNRNSVISTQSNSSESCGPDTGSVSDTEQTECTSGSSPKNTMTQADSLSLTKTQEKKVYYIAKEVMTSERVYVDVLRLLNIEFRDYVQRARFESKNGIMPDQDFVKLFSNLPELMMLNEDLLRDFEERISRWDDIKKIADVIIKKGPYLKLYTVYIRDFSAMNFHFDECCQRYPKFGKLVKEFEKLPRCQHLKLKHFMLKPVQRLPQYKLLLEDYLKHLATDSADFDDTTLALKIVSDAAEHANDTVKQGDKFQTMLKLQSRLGDWEFIRPGRELLKEGELQKISRKGVGPRYFILLSDCLLYTSYHGSWAGDSTTLKVSYTIPLNQLHVHVPTAEDFQNEFSITSNVRSCTLKARDVTERNSWLDALNSAIEEYRSRKATFVTLDHLNPILRFEGKVGDAAPVWIPDQRVTMCQSCSTEFSLVSRRHHCRGCGKVVCAQCSASKAPLRYRQFEPSRVCDNCYDAVERIYGEDMDLRLRFKRVVQSRSHVARFVPQRLKISANSEGSQVSGYLRRKQRGLKWKRSWFVLKDRVLYTYKASEDTVAIDTLPVLGWSISLLDKRDLEAHEGISSSNIFKLTHQGSPPLFFAAENENSAEKWRRALRDAVAFT